MSQKKKMKSNKKYKDNNLEYLMKIVKYKIVLIE